LTIASSEGQRVEENANQQAFGAQNSASFCQEPTTANDDFDLNTQ
jgi:hypothetical protein